MSEIQTSRQSRTLADIGLAVRRLGPGLALAILVALISDRAEPILGEIIHSVFGAVYRLPAIVIALLIGMSLYRLAQRPLFEPGLDWSVRTLLRIAIALLGVRIALSDIVDLGLATALLVIVSMTMTIVSAVWFSRLLNLDDGYGALAGAANAVCGASATLAAASVVPNYPRKGADVAFTVMAANAVSTLAMVFYPPLSVALGLDTQATGILLGATIHDMAQVVGAGYAVSEPVGNAAVIVKLFRVFLLLPVVLALGLWFTRRGGEHGAAQVPMPTFAFAFLGLCILNSAIPLTPSLAPIYAPIKLAMVQASGWGLLIAIAALGLCTSFTSLMRIGWRHVTVFVTATLVILCTVAGALLI
ncbi:YeiH family protein [Pseudorhodoplanes sinuspersici]|uniref:Sulfate exporter family transporter n=1 Tax=Pseudorhodoplanes sinuspersici TaxID=1235591 RepID=A0A1W6ZPE1_9HYPH|nr:putative sulfate exporter family transporter [Pseudorhodoplanes sinuspersici]ARP99268.1 hypothetical protein CAK95_09370 [Pseudorhodoplanes sinuspersici]